MFSKLDMALLEVKKCGAAKASCKIIRSEEKEFNVEASKITLMRTILDTSLMITAITEEGALGTATINSLLEEDIKQAAKEVYELAKASKPDVANDISSFEEGLEEYEFGSSDCDDDLLYMRVTELLDEIKRDYPLIQMDIIFGFNNIHSWYKNTNDVKFKTKRSSYTGYAMFVAKDKDKSSSMNGVEFYLNDLNKPLIEVPRFKDLLNETIEQLNPRSIKDKFIGDIVFTPEMTFEFVHYFKNVFLNDTPLISGTSVLKDKLNEAVISPLVTIYENPEESKAYFITQDGFRAKNEVYVKDGALKKFGLTLYGEKKTGFPHALSSGHLATMAKGKTPLCDLIKDVKRGILLCRFSGGNPSESGDFSGVAKNSFYIEDGKILYPINETMITGNILEIFKNIDAVSIETAENAIITSPWMRSKNINITSV